MNREEMNRRTFAATAEITTLLRRGNNARLFTRLAIQDFVATLKGEQVPVKYKNLENMMDREGLNPKRKASVRRFLREHFAPTEGETPKTVQICSPPGAQTFGEPELGDRRWDIVYTQEFARVLWVLGMAQYNRPFTRMEAITRSGISESSASNITSSLHPQVSEDWCILYGDWTSVKVEDLTRPTGYKLVYKVTRFTNPDHNRLVERLKGVFGELLWTMVDPSRIPEDEVGILDLFGASA